MMMLCFSCCKKDADVNTTPQLPPETQEGKNTFGCLVNGDVWLPQVPPNASGVTKLNADYSNGQFFVAAYLKSSLKDESIAINVLSNMYSEGNYILKDANNINKNARGIFINLINGCELETDSVNTGLLIIKRRDTVARIIAGTFNFSVTKEGCNSINIADGRFDIKY